MTTNQLNLTILLILGVSWGMGCKKSPRTGYLINSNGNTGGVWIDKPCKFVKVVVSNDTISFYGDGKLISRSWKAEPTRTICVNDVCGILFPPQPDPIHKPQ